ncbi:MAG: TetR/AcrR family transcriptional regulator [Saprospiraceae bacterium]|nr:TetR/AcrR family transcriptional regulator [Saprospiraceae bacterium]
MTSREKLIALTAKLIREKGLTATGINEVLIGTGIPKGSLYHHFPGGKDELVSAALISYKDLLARSMTNHMKGKGDAVAGLEAVVDFFISELQDSGYVHGCPLATVALETAGINHAVSATCLEVMSGWVEKLDQYFTYKNCKAGKEAAEDFIVRLEGAILLSKIYKDVRPLHRLKSQINSILYDKP